ncbi:MAG: hypothetical protein RIR90_989 [Bacteroidota bacterium]
MQVFLLVFRFVLAALLYFYLGRALITLIVQAIATTQHKSDNAEHLQIK